MLSVVDRNVVMRRMTILSFTIRFDSLPSAISFLRKFRTFVHWSRYPEQGFGNVNHTSTLETPNKPVFLSHLLCGQEEQIYAAAYSIVFRRPIHNELISRSFLKTSPLLTRSPTLTDVGNSLDCS